MTKTFWKDVEESLDALMKAEDISSKTAAADFASAKEHMVQTEKVAIQELVSSAFKALAAKVEPR